MVIVAQIVLLLLGPNTAVTAAPACTHADPVAQKLLGALPEGGAVRLLGQQQVEGVEHIVPVVGVPAWWGNKTKEGLR